MKTADPQPPPQQEPEGNTSGGADSEAPDYNAQIAARQEAPQNRSDPDLTLMDKADLELELLKLNVSKARADVGIARVAAKSAALPATRNIDNWAKWVDLVGKTLFFLGAVLPLIWMGASLKEANAQKALAERQKIEADSTAAKKKDEADAAAKALGEAQNLAAAAERDRAKAVADRNGATTERDKSLEESRRLKDQASVAKTERDTLQRERDDLLGRVRTMRELAEDQERRKREADADLEKTRDTLRKLKNFVTDAEALKAAREGLFPLRYAGDFFMNRDGKWKPIARDYEEEKGYELGALSFGGRLYESATSVEVVIDSDGNVECLAQTKNLLSPTVMAPALLAKSQVVLELFDSPGNRIAQELVVGRVQAKSEALTPQHMKISEDILSAIPAKLKPHLMLRLK